MLRRVRKNKKGFTLIELIIVIAIIAILAALLLPKVGMVKENTNKTAACPFQERTGCCLSVSEKRGQAFLPTL